MMRAAIGLDRHQQQQQQQQQHLHACIMLLMKCTGLLVRGVSTRYLRPLQLKTRNRLHSAGSTYTMHVGIVPAMASVIIVPLALHVKISI